MSKTFVQTGPSESDVGRSVVGAPPVVAGAVDAPVLDGAVLDLRLAVQVRNSKVSALVFQSMELLGGQQASSQSRPEVKHLLKYYTLQTV